VADDLAFLPYGRQSIDDDDIAAVVRVLKGDYLTTGPAVAAFEAKLAEVCGAKWAVAVTNGTAALHAACAAAGIGPGDEVVVPAMTFLATANCARYLGAEPVFCDVHPDTGLLDPDAARAKVTDRTKAIIPVHVTGASAATRFDGLTVIEDAAHALGGTNVGACADSAMAIFSFHPVKHATTGEGGAITGNDPALERFLRRFRNHGMRKDELRNPSPGPWYYEQHGLGHNLRMTDMQAALGTSQLGKLPGFVARRRALAARYDERLASLDGVEPVTGSGGDSAYHLYSVLLDFERFGVSRAELMARLREVKIGTQVHYIPVPMQPYYADRGWRVEDFPGARRYYERTLSLPLFPAMADTDVDRVVEALQSGLQRKNLP